MTLPLNIIPNLPSINLPLIRTVKTPSGDVHYMHETWHACLSQLVTGMQNHFSNEGVTIPNQSTSNIALLTSKNFALIADNQLNVAKIILNGVVKTITTS